MIKIKVFGIGGAGGNIVSQIASEKIRGVEFLVANTDAQALSKLKVDKKIRIGKKTTQGLGTGMNPEIGKESAKESEEEIKQAISDTDLLIIVAGLGGGTGTGASPVVAEIAKKQKKLVFSLVTLPFSFEGEYRKKVAQEGLEELKKRSDTVLVVNNEKLLEGLDKKVSFLKAFQECDALLKEIVKAISNLILDTGIISTNFADLKAILENGKTAFFGKGKAEGEKAAQKAVSMAFNSPFLESSIKGSKGILLNITGGKGMSLTDIQEAIDLVSKEIEKTAKIIFGAFISNRLKEKEIQVTIIATGF